MSNTANARTANAGSRTDPPLAKAEPISDGGSTSGITYLRREKKLQQERGVRIRERNNFPDTKVSEEGGTGGAPGAGAEVPLQTMEKTMVRQAVPLQPVEVHGGAEIYLQPRKDLHSPRPGWTVVANIPRLGLAIVSNIGLEKRRQRCMN